MQKLLPLLLGLDDGTGFFELAPCLCVFIAPKPKAIMAENGWKDFLSKRKVQPCADMPR